MAVTQVYHRVIVKLLRPGLPNVRPWGYMRPPWPILCGPQVLLQKFLRVAITIIAIC